jgi:glucose/arabinose dehydrogenase/PKD repeat protein
MFRLLAVTSALGVALHAAPASASTLPPNFQESTVFSGLTNPTAVRFASDGRVFVAEKSGLIKVFASLTATTPTIFADLRTNVHNFWDRGLLGLELDPNFPTTPYVYVLYTLDRSPATMYIPRWGTAGATADGCPTPPGPTSSGCGVMARLSRLTASGSVMTGTELVLIESWCQQFPSHSIGELAFGPDGALYVSGGDGASFTAVDYGQFGGTGGTALNMCGDPPVGVGGTQTPATAEGGALRSQSLGRPAGQPVTLSGAILRVSPTTGQALPDNPLITHTDPRARRIIAYGLRNPFRFALRPGTNEIWVGDVGWNTWEEIERFDRSGGPVPNFGWPCYEGDFRQPGYDATNLGHCERLYTTNAAVEEPFFKYNHAAKVVPGETCPTGSSAIAGLAFYGGGNYPAGYDGALFFTDYNRRCIWAMMPDGSGTPNPANVVTFAAGLAGGAVGLRIGPGGDLFYVDFGLGRIQRIRYFGANQPPLAVATADRTNGAAPLTVRFDASQSSDPDGGALRFAWDLDGDGAFDDSTLVSPVFTYSTPGNRTVRLRATDADGASATDSLTISVANTPPSARIPTPLSSLTWKVGDVIAFSGSATDAQQGTLPASALTWTLIMHHCPSNCHEHVMQTFAGVATGSFTAPDHEYPSHLELRLTATDAGGLTSTASVLLQPKTVVLTFASNPNGLPLGVNATSAPAPFTRRVIVGSSNSVSAPSPQTLGGVPYTFRSWSDGGAQSHTVVAPGTAATYTATYAAAAASPPAIRINDASVVEGDRGTVNAVFTVSLSAASAQTVTVRFATADGTARSGIDYLGVSGTMTFPAGTLTRTIPVPVLGGKHKENDEVFFVNLSAPVNATIRDGQGRGTIFDDDRR